MTAPAATAGELGDPNRRRGTLALALQEALTAVVRLRANRQTAADAESFRAHLKSLLAAGEGHVIYGADPTDPHSCNGYTAQTGLFEVLSIDASLREMVAASVIDTLGSNHSPAPPGLKHLDDGDLRLAWGGIASLQLLLPVAGSVFAELRSGGRLIDALTAESINAFLKKNPPEDFLVVTLGPQPLEVPVGIS